jgi:TP901 family phage tail tape measure protein
MNITQLVFEILMKDNNVFVQFNRLNDQVNLIGQSVNGLNLDIKNKIARMDLSATLSLVEKTAGALNAVGSGGVGFDRSMRELSAITGVVGSELKQLQENSRRIGIETGLGASGAAEAYRTLASQIEIDRIGIRGLNELQQKSITLAQASGLSIGASATALAATINQFGFEASEANRVINVLAAGSKYGAAEIPDLAMSLKTVGSAAAAARIDLEQTTAAIEILSQNNVIGAEAGTKLRNIILRLQTKGGVDFSRQSLGEALAKLQPQISNATYLTKLFGMENVAAAQFMIANAAAIDEMTGKLTGTNTALEQAAIINESVETGLNRFRARIDDLKLSLFEISDGWTAYAGVAAEVANESVGIVVVILGLSKAYRALQASQALATARQLLYNASLYSCPLVWFAGAVVAVGAAFAGMNIIMNKVNASQTVASRVTGDLSRELFFEKKNLNDLFEALKRTSPESDTRRRLIAEMNEKYPDYLKGISLEKAGIDEITGAQKKANDELARNIFLKNLRDTELAGIQDVQDKQKAVFDRLFSKGFHESDIQKVLKSIEEGTYMPRSYTQYGFGGSPYTVFDYSYRGQASGEIIDLLNATGNNAGALTALRAFGRTLGIGTSLMDAVNGTGTVTGGTGNGTGGGGTTPTNNSVSAGGSRNSTVNISLGNMVENMVFNGTLTENRENVRRQMEEILFQVLYAAQSAG